MGQMKPILVVNVMVPKRIPAILVLEVEKLDVLLVVDAVKKDVLAVEDLQKKDVGVALEVVENPHTEMVGQYIHLVVLVGEEAETHVVPAEMVM